jgi:hypothetical protein
MSVDSLFKPACPDSYKPGPLAFTGFLRNTHFFLSGQENSRREGTAVISIRDIAYSSMKK